MSAGWSKHVVTWREQDCLCLSVPFTWFLPEARAIALNHPGERVIAGGPAVCLMREYVEEWAEVETIELETPALQRHNPHATRTSYGCPFDCPFCMVRLIEGTFRELDQWRPAPIICDDNLLACSERHLERVWESLKGIRGLDFQGIEPHLVTPENAAQIAVLHPKAVRMGWDMPEEEGVVWQAIQYLRQAGLPKRAIGVYCLVNWKESPEEALYRFETLKSAGIRGFAMRFQPADLPLLEPAKLAWAYQL